LKEQAERIYPMLVTKCRNNKGFTLIELLVVIAIMIGLMAMGSMAMGDFFSQGSFRLGIRAVVNGLNAARQTAIGQRKWVWLETYDAEGEGKPELNDYVAFYMMDAEENDAGAMEWRYKNTEPVEKVELPKNIELDVIPDPAPAAYTDMGLNGKRGILFYPNGSCQPLDDKTVVLEVLDAVTRDRAKVFIYTVTGFIRVKLVWKD